MAINRSTQQRQNYGLGSFVKKAFNKVTRPFTKVAQKLMPKELAGVARMAAPFAAASGIPYAALIGGGLSAAGQAKQKGRINPFETAFAAAPGLRFAGGEGLGQFGITGVGGKTGAGRNTLRDLFLRGDITAGETLRDKPIFGKYGAQADKFLYGKDDTFADVQGPREAVPGSSGDTFDITKEGPGLGRKLYEAEGGLLGDKGKFDMFNSKAVDLAIRKKDGKTLSPVKIGAWGMSIYSGIKAAKYKTSLEAQDAAEQALLAADASASEGDILEAREWAQTVFGRLSRADIGLAEGGRVNYAIGSNPLPSDPTAPVNPFKPKPIGPVLPNKEMAAIDVKLLPMYNQAIDSGEIGEEISYEMFKEQILKLMADKNQSGQQMAAEGGLMRNNYALGTKPEPKESGLGGLPIEADMRYSGGFMPYGKKEKADDVPARLSKNEFVFTADAVKAAGGGSMNEGARKMYQTMKMLEQQNRMMS